MTRRFLFRCDAGRVPEVGTGHVRRCITLAQRLRDQGDEARFVVRADAHAALVEAAGFPLTTFDDDECAVLAHEVAAFRPHVCVLDVLDTSPEQVEACRRGATVVACLDDLGAGPDHADLVINAIRESDRATHAGPDYLVLPPVEAPAQKEQRGDDGLHVLLSFGGYDHQGLAQTALDALCGPDAPPGVARVDVIAARADAEGLEPPEGGPEVQVLADVPDFPRRMAEADLAVVSGGLTLFEALRAGTPAVVVPQYDHQADTARRYEERGGAVLLEGPGAGADATPLRDRLRATVADLAADAERRRAMARAGAHLVDGKGLERVADLLTVCRHRAWDTEFFGRRVAELTTRRLTPALIEQGLHLARGMDADCVYYLADCHHPLSVRLAERHGFHFVDIRLTFEHDLQDVPDAEPEAEGVRVRLARAGDVPVLKEVAGTSYEMSRYYFDRHFPRERCTAFYTEWIEKSCDGYVDAVLVAEVDGEPAGYVSCRLGERRGAIELVGIAASARGHGVGTHLIDHALWWFKQNGMEAVDVVTQGRNFAAQRLYQRAGFVTRLTQLWYHKWFDADPEEP